MKVMLDGVIALSPEMVDRYGLALRVEVDMTPTEDGLLIRKRERQPGDPIECPYTIPAAVSLGP